MTKKIPFLNLSNDWTLFLDRDGVINYEKHLDYINKWEEFKFYERVPEGIKIFSELFGKIIIVTNQKGVGKGITKIENLHLIHLKMKKAINAEGGRIDAIYYCTDLDNESPNRKPNPGMAFKAKEKFPEIDFSKSVMIGNTLSDMQFGRNIGAVTIFLPTTRPEVSLSDEAIDLVFPSLYDAAVYLNET